MAISINTKSKAVIAKAVAVLKNVIKTAKTTCGIIARKTIANTNLIANMINSFISSPLFIHYNTQISNVNIRLDKKKIPPILANKLTDDIFMKVICFLTLQMEQVSPFPADLGRLKESNLD